MVAMKYIPWLSCILLALAILLKLDLLLMGYYLFPMVFWRTVFGVCVGAVLAFYFIRHRHRRWYAILPLLIFQPFFPSPAGMYLLGYSRCVEKELNLPEIVVWAENYQFEQQIEPRPEEIDSYAYDRTLVSIPGVPKKFGQIFISRYNRTVRILGGSVQGVVIGTDAVSVLDEQQILSAKKRLTEQAYVWVNAEPR